MKFIELAMAEGATPAQELAALTKLNDPPAEILAVFELHDGEVIFNVGCNGVASFSQELISELSKQFSIETQDHRPCVINPEFFELRVPLARQQHFQDILEEIFGNAYPDI
jgi:hypothetical protein